MKKSTASVLLLLVMVGFLGISLIASGSEEKKAIEKGITDFNTMTPMDFNAGRFVEGNVYEVFGEFAYMESSNETLGIKYGSRVTSHYYLILLSGSPEWDTPLFIALELKSKEAVGNAELLLEQTIDYETNDKEPDVWNEFYVQGKLQKLDGELEDFLYDWLTDEGTDGTRADYEDMICPYVISERTEDSVGSDITAGIVMCAAGFGGAAAILMLLIRARISSGNAPAAYAEASYTPVSGGSPANGYSPVNQSGSVSSPSDGGESARLMEEMSRLSQPSDADEFFSKPVSRKYPESHGSDDPGLGIGIGDDDK